MSTIPVTDRTRVRRLPDRGAYDREVINSILDEGFLCHVGFVAEGAPVVIPTGYGRDGDILYIHGSAASRMLRSLQQGIEMCVTVTLVDGLVLARSAFHHSMNYRSVVAFGRATLVEDPAEKLRALTAISEQIVRGRWEDARKPTAQEMKATTVLALPLSEVSAKIRTGPPKDDEEDYALPIWAGVVPIKLEYKEPVADAKLAGGLAVPAYARRPKG
ncbi:MAG TPA: pyridoxamine 5'-phosphate oxidase family protein [Candidatus Saccharimonadales bacterium]|jgi:nitroimidazol reductase NimA-like FMN-containing flavoprotein (pyridoxamine 5'-phosphate oxidase superfamily)|nr:pyridoxamine 5'-phosphate oxidase family protein [Candidatus Saccharimonadales bacterium]